MSIKEMEPINLGQTVSGSWDAGTFSNLRSGSYAKHFTFSLSEETTVVISLTSETDTFLNLFQGLDVNDRLIAYNDDENHSRNSQLIKTLQLGTYTIEATTCYEGETGSFELSLSLVNLPSDSSIQIGQTLSGTWNAEAPRSNWRPGNYYAQHYSFWLPEEDTITISLTSEVDTFLLLFKGTDTNERPIEHDDDGGGNRNSRLVETLPPGLYTIEATTCCEEQEGSFELSLTGMRD